MLLKDAFSKAFAKSDLVLVCPLYAAGEKKNSKFDIYKFAELISKNSKKQTVLVKSEIELANFLKKNLITDEIIIGMGAGIISKWIRNLQYNL